MTLNITALSPTVIYQSSDFRLTRKGQFITDRSGKTVTLSYKAWNGFVTYTGLGRCFGKDISAWVSEWLADSQDRSMAQVASRLSEKGANLLEMVYRRDHNWMRHTFILAGIEGNVATIFVISNYEDCFGRERNVVDGHLNVTTRRVHKGDKPLIVVTGYKKAVSSADRNLLANLIARYPMEGGRIRRRMEALNARAAPKSQGLVSNDCIVISFRSDGSGVQQLNNAATQTPTSFPHIYRGVNMLQFMAEALRNIGFDTAQARLIQGAFGSSHHNVLPSLDLTACSFGVTGGGPSVGYDLAEITASDFEPTSASDINDGGLVIGTGRLNMQSPPNIPWRWSNGEVAQLNYRGLARAINIKGDVAAMLQGTEGERAALYHDESLSVFPLYHGEAGVFRGTDSYADAITTDRVFGIVRSRVEESGRPNVRAAAFNTETAPQVLTDLCAEHGCRVVDANERGDVLIMAGVAPSQARSIVWKPTSGNWTYIGDPDLNVFPIAITNGGLILGQARNERGDPVAVLCIPGQDWKRLGTQDGWVPVDINDQGDVVGWAWIERIQRPWLRLNSGDIILLPYVTEHNTCPAAINNSGQIAGAASADHGSHAIIWQPL